MRRTQRLIATLPLLLALIVFAGVPAGAQVLPSRLVAADWISANFGKTDIRIIDMRPDIRDYWSSHLPGALYLNPESLRWPENGVPVKLLPAQALAQLLGNMGITPATPVIVYSEKNGFMPLYLLWALDYLGHKDCALLEGGFDKWKADGRFLTQDFPTKIKTVVYPLPAKLHTEVRATIDEVKEAASQGVILLDSRPPETFSGEKGTWRRRGHIPGAINRFWNGDLNADGSWKSKDEIRADYAALGVTADKKVIVYCGSGQMASHTYFVLKYILGFPSVKNFDGSFGEWTSDPQLAVEKTAK